MPVATARASPKRRAPAASALCRAAAKPSISQRAAACRRRQARAGQGQQEALHAQSRQIAAHLGYALQGSPAQPGAPKEAAPQTREGAAALVAAGIEPTARAEEISLEKFCALARVIAQ